MRLNLPALLFVIPFLTAVALPLIGLFRKHWCRSVALASLSMMHVMSLMALNHTLEMGPIRYPLGGWLPPIGIEWRLDGFSGLAMVLISLVALVAVVYAGPGVRTTLAHKAAHVYTLVMLLISALTGMVMTADLFNLFVFLEVTALTGYALVAVAGGRAMLAAFRYLILGTIGASFYLLGVGYLYAATGTLNMADLADKLRGLWGSTAVLTGLVFIIIGLGIKMALVPLHGWLPDAYAHAPEAISPLLASLITKVALVALARIMFWMLGADVIWDEVPVMVYLGWIGAIATLAGAFLALSEQNIRRTFAYGGISHVGLVVMGISLGNLTGFAGGIFYLMTDAVMQLGLFFVAGAMASHYGVREVAEVAHLRGRTPWMTAALIVTALSMVGIPPTGGFFGKWYILMGALEMKNYVAVGVIVLSTVLTLAYFVRILEKMFGEGSTATRQDASDLPWEMRFGMGTVTAGLLLFGIFSDPVISFIRTVAAPPGF
jgi:multicomponent Na+:H+ antiporter subunit D